MRKNLIHINDGRENLLIFSNCKASAWLLFAFYLFNDEESFPLARKDFLDIFVDQF